MAHTHELLISAAPHIPVAAGFAAMLKKLFG